MVVLACAGGLLPMEEHEAMCWSPEKRNWPGYSPDPRGVQGGGGDGFLHDSQLQNMHLAPGTQLAFWIHLR